MKKAISMLAMLAIAFSCLIVSVPALAIQEDGALDAKEAIVETTEVQPAKVIDGGTFGEGLSWSFDENNKLTISGKGDMPDYEWPWDKYKEFIASVEIKNGVTRIGYYAFKDCSNLTSIEMPTSVKSIGLYAFSGCGNLTSVEIPESVTSIENCAFSDCNSLSSIVIPDGVKRIELSTFWNCSSLTSVTIPNSVVSIDGSAFYGCSSLASVTIPDSVISIGNMAFSGCSSLNSVTIPTSVTSIGDGVFLGSDNIEEITVGQVGLDAITFTTTIKKVKLLDDVTHIGTSAFDGCSGLISVAIPESVTSIGDSAFYGCSGLTQITIPESVTSIGDSAFYGCSGLTQITIPESVTSIGNYAFDGCSSLTSVKIPNSVTSIGLFIFSGCENIEKVSIGQTGLDVLYLPKNLREVELLDGVTSIKDRAFYDFGSLASVTIPESVTSIGNYAFSGCNGLTSVTIPESVTSIGEHAFDGCSSLTSVQIPNSITGIANYSFFGCSSLTSIDIPNSVTHIGMCAFDGCRSLMPVIIPESVVSIGSLAFDNCDNMKTAIILGDPDIVDWPFIWDCKLLFEKKLSSAEITLSKETFIYNAKEHRPTVSVKTPLGRTLKQGTDFTVTYKNNINPGKAVVIIEGIGNYSKTVTKEFTIDKISITTDKVKLEYTKVKYDGEEKEPIITIAGLKQGTDFTVTYHNNVNVGTATVTIQGIGNYKDTVTKEFTISKGNISDYKIFLEYERTKYDGNAKEPYVGVGGLMPGEHFTVTYSNNINAGTATVTITGIGNYQGTITKNFVIELAKGDALFGNETKLRIYGPNRYETSVKTADALKKSMGVSKFENIVIASGNGYADALSGAYLASVKNAPVLVVGSDKWSPGYIQSYIKDNLKEGGTVYILGGTGAVSKSFEDGLKQASCKVKRLGGSDRYATNIMVLKEAGVGSTDVLVCSGNGYADSLSASAVGKPILLVNKKLYTSQNEYLSKLSSRTYYLIGGEGAVNNTIATDLTSYGKTKRVSGANRYGTSVAVARQFFGSAPENVVFAYGLDFPDGLSGGPLAYSIDGPLLLITSRDFGAASDYVKGSEIKKAATLGGPLLISDKAINSIMS